MTTARKIARIPGLGLYAMPASYDPAKMTEDDAAHDSAICGARAELETHEATAIQNAEMARDTAAIGYEGEAAERRTMAAEEALDSTETAWTEALEAADRGDDNGLREALEEAKRIGQAWGDCSPENAALDLLAS